MQRGMRRPAYGQENCAHIEESVHTKKSMHTGLYIDCLSLVVWLMNQEKQFQRVFSVWVTTALLTSDLLEFNT